MLTGIRILDVSNYLSGPLASLFLAGLGADVIKVERPQTGDPCRWNPPFANQNQVSFERQAGEDLSLIFLKRNRNKKSITLNLQSLKGKEIFKELAQKVDVVLENFTPGVMDRLGLGYEVLKEKNPRLIYCSISGFGQTGPYNDLQAYDLVIQAMSGVMAITGEEGGPPLRAGFLIGDQSSALFAVIGILSAYIESRRTGKGRAVDISMQDCLFSMIMDDAWEMVLSQGLPLRTGNRVSRLAPFSVYPSQDGYVVICTASDDQWLNLLKAMGREDLAENPLYRQSASRVKNVKEVEALIKEWLKEKTAQTAIEILRRNRVPCSPVLEIQEVLNDPQLQHRKMITDLKHPVYGKVCGASGAGFPIKYSGIELAYEKPAPLLGQDNEEIYGQFLEYDGEKLAQLKKEGVI
jgi:crotonobetainyl-CoA:carnitine CoA-transferase CaiB-like acyl-CoA transferase